MLIALGWEGAFTVQEKLDPKGRANVPDYGFFPDEDSFRLADGVQEPEKRLVHVQEGSRSAARPRATFRLHSASAKPASSRVNNQACG
ncbi:MAG: hypothetical protein JO288_02710 [Hyphomicrobiales bacterium]|nr:hypothetical protein [Hyphomicrobiales bacterium]